MQKEPTIQDVLDAMAGYASHTNKQIAALQSDVSLLKNDVSTLKNQMVTKDYLDDKLADLRADLVVLLRIEAEVVTQDAAKRVLALEPFPQ